MGAKVRLLLDDLSLFIRAAHLAYAMRKLQFSALIAFHHARNFQLEVSTALIATGLRCFPERYCHVPTSFKELPCCSIHFKKIRQSGEPRVHLRGFAAAWRKIAVVAAHRTKPLAIFPANGRERQRKPNGFLDVRFKLYTIVGNDMGVFKLLPANDLRPVRKQLAERNRKRLLHRSQTAGAGELNRKDKRSCDFDHALGGVRFEVGLHRPERHDILASPQQIGHVERSRKGDGMSFCRQFFSAKLHGYHPKQTKFIISIRFAFCQHFQFMV